MPYCYIVDCYQDIIYSLFEKIDKTKINDDNYITTFINYNLLKEINTTIYNKLLSYSSYDNQKFIEINNYNIFHCIHFYKKYYKDDEEFKELLMDNENYLEEKKEIIFFAKLALVIIYDDIINNNEKLNDLKEEIKDYIKNYNNYE